MKQLASGFKFPLPIAPIAPEPFVPVGFTPMKLMTVIDESTALDRLAVTETLVKAAVAKVRQTSEVPACAFVLSTRTHVNPAPVTLAMVAVPGEGPSLEMNASNSSLADFVENVDVVTVLLGVPWSFDVFTSMAMAACDVKLTPERLVPLTPTVRLAGVNVKPVLAGVTV